VQFENLIIGIIKTPQQTKVPIQKLLFCGNRSEKKERHSDKMR
jgi:hypothetical protein